jgi:hypothetical protein
MKESETSFDSDEVSDDFESSFDEDEDEENASEDDDEAESIEVWLDAILRTVKAEKTQMDKVVEDASV